jgi:hypothetical protein
MHLATKVAQVAFDVTSIEYPSSVVDLTLLDDDGVDRDSATI